MFALPAPFRLRPVVCADQVFLDALYRSSRHDLAQAVPNEHILVQLLQMQQNAQANSTRMRFPEAATLVLEREMTAIGRVVVEAANGRVHLIDLLLSPDARGQGAGTLVLRALQDLAAQRGEPLTLTVSHANGDARRLYLRLGFVVGGKDQMNESLRWVAPGTAP